MYYVLITIVLYSSNYYFLVFFFLIFFTFSLFVFEYVKILSKSRTAAYHLNAIVIQGSYFYIDVCFVKIEYVNRRSNT